MKSVDAKDSKWETRNVLAGVVLGTAFLVSVGGDHFFENQWSNPFWYLFEAIVWGIGFTCFFLLLRPGGSNK